MSLFFTKAVVSVGALLSFFYNVVVSWSIWYFFTSVSSFPLEWSTCDHDYNTQNCYSRLQEETQCGRDNDSNIFLYNNSCISVKHICEMANLTAAMSSPTCSNGSLELPPEVLLDRKSTSVEEFWHKHVLGDAEQYNWENFVRNFKF
jgi:Sodium:neurotransmitter symporter family